MRVIVGWQGTDKQAASTNTMSRFETETLTPKENLEGLARLNVQWVERAMARTPHRRVILDMDSSESPVHGEQEGATYNGHFESVCYHPLFLFNEFGDWEGTMLRPGNVHSADRWREVLEPVVKRYQEKGVRLLFRADAAFAKPEVYEYLESRDTGYAMRLGGILMGLCPLLTHLGFVAWLIVEWSNGDAGDYWDIFGGIGSSWRTDEPSPLERTESPTRFRRLCLRALAENEISESKAAELLRLRVSEIEGIMAGSAA